MEPINLLFADDDADIQQIVEFTLRDENINLIFAENGSQALTLWRTRNVQILILDIMMPLIDGLDVCKRVRQLSDVPIIMMTAKDQEQDIINAFDAGADDYIVKPFIPKELISRIRMLLYRNMRQRISPNRQLAFNSLVLDLEKRRVTSSEKCVQVTPLEYRLLKYLMQNAGVVISKENLLKNVWGYAESNGDTNLIEATIRRLRKKVEPDPSQPRYIQTIWGAGYRLGD
ncbi:MAG: response regulator transcription factor [Anaerolineales bacterium]|nr:MAG: response regulator transcription factor [Anaerolineales bacterium]